MTPPILEAPVETTLSDAKRRLLAQRLKGLKATTAGDASADLIPRRPDDAKTIITPEQYSVWMDSTLQPDIPTYNEPITLRYRGHIDHSALEAAFNAFIARHEAWRSSFSVQNGEVVQDFHPQLQIEIPSVDLTELPESDREAESNRIATAQATTPIALDSAPLFRVTLVHTAPDDARLHLVLHHLIFDGFSLYRTFLPELAALYDAFAAGVEPSLPPVTLHYSDYAHWHRQQVNSPAIEPHLAYWRKQLEGELSVLRLPTDRPRPAAITHRGAVVRFNLSRQLTESLHQTALATGATLYMAMLATLKILLYRYSGQQDVILGSVSDARRRPELASMVGYILDLVALRTQLNPEASFAETLRQVRSTVLGALAAAEAPFEKVVATLMEQAGATKRDLSHNPIFQTVFAFQPTGTSTASAWEASASQITTGASKFDLYIEADEKPAHTAVRIFYSTDLFDEATIHRLASHWTTLIEAAATTPDLPIAQLPILTPAERDMMLVGWNQLDAPLPYETMHGLVAAQAHKTPNSPAVTFDGNTLTYAQLERESDRLAWHLRAAGAAPGTLAAVYLDRSEYLVAGLLGILKTGAAYMPLDPGTPSARVALCLEDGTPAVILTQRSRRADLPSTNSNILVLEDILDARYPDSFVPTAITPDSLAYVIHTSGSTGRPKGVELHHRGVVNFLLSMQRTPGLTPGDVLVAVTTISFDIAVLELFLPLITGARVVIASRETAVDPAKLAKLVASVEATFLQATPATWSALIGINWPGQVGLKALCGGEALNRSLADRLLALKLDLWNVYGPTETTIWSTLQRVHPGSGPISVGRPIANTTTYILDSNQQPVPVGVPGELYIGGAGVARGYRNRPALTAEKFVTPAIVNGQRLYRTGDYALYRRDGSIECQGRADNQVKIRGYRIELEDVEVNLAAHPAVAAAAARAWPDPDGGYRLCAYLTGVNGPPPNAAELRQFLRERVAEYMIPTEIIALDALPLTSNGKVDRKQLPEPTYSPSPTEAPAAFASSLQGEELRLARIWAQLLHVDSITATDNFFDLGGHSLLLLKLIRLINKEFSIELPMTRLFQAPTIGQLALVVRELSAPEQTEWSSLVPLNPNGTRRPLFLIHSLMLYGRMPAALGEDQPIYGLQPLPFVESEAEGYVERMLDDHVRQIRRVQPNGPYQIVGWCFAGWFAYEIARKLEESGQRVETLALLDSWCPYKMAFIAEPQAETTETATSTRRSLFARFHSLAFRLDFRRRQFVAVPAGERLAYFRRAVRDTWVIATIPFERSAKSALYRWCRTFRLPLPASLRDVNVVTYNWLRSYQVKPYTGDITLVRAGDLPVPPDSDPNCGWRAFTSGQIRSHSIPGDRSTMFLGDNLRQLAQLLRSLTEGTAAR
jgi:amino acid adenylation domain-containing protein